MIKLCIDPGHGMSNRRDGRYDPGAVSGGLQEADVALMWALTGKWVLQREGIEVFLTRDDDRDEAPVGLRDDRAGQAGCTHFISLHCNAGGGRGAETYFRDEADEAFALAVHRVLMRTAMTHSRGVKHESLSQHGKLAVFGFHGPACLVELGFIDNAVDRDLLMNRDARIRFWEGMAEWLKTYR